MLGVQSFTSMKEDLCQDLSRGFAFSKCLNGIFPWRKWSIKVRTYFRPVVWWRLALNMFGQWSLLGPEWQFRHLKSNWAQSWWWKQMCPKTSPPDWADWESVSEYQVKKLQLGFSSQSRRQRRAEGTWNLKGINN